MWTIGGPNAGVGTGVVAGQVMGVMMAIQKEGEQRFAVYMVAGVGAGAAKWGASLASGPSSVSEFESGSASEADQFGGSASIIDASVQAMVSYGWTRITWLSGAASGTVCEGWGGSFNVAVGAGTSSTMVIFTLVAWDDGKAKAASGMYTQPQPEVFTDKYGRQIYK